MENPYQSVGKRIRFFRKKKKLSQAQLAEKAELSDNYVGLIERGVKQPPLHTLNSLANALDIELRELFDIGASEKGNKEASNELKKLLSKKNFKDAELLLAIYKAICANST